MVTTFRVSKDYDQHSAEHPRYDISQGAINGPPGWTQTSDVIIKLHNTKAYGSMLWDPTKKITVSQSVDMFVDDVSLIVNNTKSTFWPKQ